MRNFHAPKHATPESGQSSERSNRSPQRFARHPRNGNRTTQGKTQENIQLLSFLKKLESKIKFFAQFVQFSTIQTD